MAIMRCKEKEQISKRTSLKEIDSDSRAYPSRRSMPPPPSLSSPRPPSSSAAHQADVSSPLQTLVEDQAMLSVFWSEWRAAEHKFLCRAEAKHISPEYNHLPAETTPTRRSSRRRPRATTVITDPFSSSRCASPGRAATACEENKEGEEEEVEDLESLLLSSMLLFEKGTIFNSSRMQQQHQHQRRHLSSLVQQENAVCMTEEDRDAKQAECSGVGGGKKDEGEDVAARGEGATDAGAALARQAAYEAKIQKLEAQMVETEVLLGSDTGTIILGLERELAQTRLELAEMEAAKDDLEVQLVNLLHKTSEKRK